MDELTKVKLRAIVWGLNPQEKDGLLNILIEDYNDRNKGKKQIAEVYIDLESQRKEIFKGLRG